MNTQAIAHVPSSSCLNCGTAVHDLYCGHCGQDTANHMPSAAEFLHEFVGHYVALENKLLKTLSLLLFKPGRLTRDYLDGKRARYVLPLRLYLTLSVIFFAMFKWQTHSFEAELGKPAVTVQQQVDQKSLDQARTDLEDAKHETGAVGGAAIATGEKAIDKLKQKAARAKQAKAAGEEHVSTVGFLDVDEDSQAWIAAHLGKSTADHARHFSKLSSQEQWRQMQAALFAYAPYAIFAMMPVFALYLKLLYLGSGRRYGEHLLFALHTNAFAFLILILLMLVPAWVPYLDAALGLWLTFYLPTAMRKVYGGSRLATFVRWIVLMALHLLGMVVAILGAFAMAVVH